jgi:hypothetical protein
MPYEYIAELSDEPSTARDVAAALIDGDDAAIDGIARRVANDLGETDTQVPDPDAERVAGLVKTNGVVVPADVATIAAVLARFLDVDPAELFVADHTHEELRPGAYSIALEGHEHDWPFSFTCALRERDDLVVPAGWFLEPQTGWLLGLFPDPTA